MVRGRDRSRLHTVRRAGKCGAAETVEVLFFASRRRHTRCSRDWSSDVCSSDLRPRWMVNEIDGGEPWFGFRAVRDLPGLPPEILVIPLPGHTRGHIGVAVDTGAGWLLHAGDAFYEIGRASCRGRVEISVGGGSF